MCNSSSVGKPSNDEMFHIHTCGMWMCIGPSTKFQIPEAALLDTRYNDNVADRRNGQPDTIWYSYFDIE